MSDYLCEELIVEIFTRIPSKSLLRFRSVSKSLYSVISSPAFIHMHTCRSRKKLFLRHITYYQREVGLEEFYTLHPEDQLPLCPRRGYLGATPVEFPFHKYAEFVGSCNGIFCYFEEKHFSLWNPSIRRILTFPDCPKAKACSLGICRLGIGFAFDPIIDDYKVVRICCARWGIFEQSSFVYAVKMGVWSEIASSTPLISNIASYGCFLNGALHWMVKSYDDTVVGVWSEIASSTPLISNIASYGCFLNGALHWMVKSYDDTVVDLHYILTFDLSTHVFEMIALPKTINKTSLLPTIQDTLPVISTIKGSLAVFSTDDDDTLHVWVRRDASWSVVYKLKKDKYFQSLDSAALTSNCDLLILSEIVHVYNLKTWVVSTLANFLEGASDIHESEIFNERLELLDMGGTACEVNKLTSFVGGRRRRSVRGTVL